MSAIEWTDQTKWCTGCKATHPLTAFGPDGSRADGLNPTCREAKNRRQRERHVSRAVPGARPGPTRLPERDGDQRQARRTVNHLVETGSIPRPNDLPCTDCGHVWAAGERRHEYDHHRGYGTGHHTDVESVCTTCHHEREERRHADQH